MTRVGATPCHIQFADLNGNGRAEYLFVHNDGSVNAWLNLGNPDDGPDAAKVGWFPVGSIASGIGVRFVDLNSDGHTECLRLDEDGAMTVDHKPSSILVLWIGERAANVVWLLQGVVAIGPAD
ncbi:hypothetical protein DFH07DRAFT_770720 [Mycena maculata]|uniref:VCBS repeat-containing protein n=1 Tax=Mycena maculata TaxID=230809 RepID=A0AAD7NJK1_9AGAR|nr:hypothetical protein DFH07DRAFT_770720 [Mycena maculata]